MDLENKEIYNILSIGVDIYDKQFKKLKLNIDGYEYTEEDLKFLSLYFAILHSKNQITEILKEMDMSETTQYQINAEDDNLENFLIKYNENFLFLLHGKKFDSIFDYFKFLLEQKGVKIYNESFGLKIDYEEDIQKKLILE